MKKSYGSVFLLQLSLGVMFVMLGIAGISGATEGLGGFTNDLDKMFGGNNGTIEVVIASIKLIAGGLLLLSLFSVVKEKVTAIFMLIILVLWAVELVIVFIANDSFLEPNALAWLGSLAPNLVILASLWLIYEARAKTGRS